MAKTTHGKSNTKEWWAWVLMRRRCMYEKATSFPTYGARGITVDPNWLVFENFFADMGKRPSPQHSLDRVDNDGPYTKTNCRWATKKEQARNRRSNRLIEYGGVTRTLAEWGEVTGIARDTIAYRLRAGWSIEKALHLLPDRGE